MMTHIVSGKPEKVVSQTLTGQLEFSWTAKRGETFRIYEILPHDMTYRMTKKMTVEKDYPMGK